MKNVVKVSIIVLFAFALMCAALQMVSTPTAYGKPKATQEPRDHKGTPDPCVAQGNCGNGDHGHGNPTKAHCNPQANQGEPECNRPTDAPRPTDVPPTQVPPTQVPTTVPPTATRVPNMTATPVNPTPAWPRIDPPKYMTTTIGCVNVVTVTVVVTKYVTIYQAQPTYHIFIAGWGRR